MQNGIVIINLQNQEQDIDNTILPKSHYLSF